MRAYRGIRNLHSRQCLTLSQRKMIEMPLALRWAASIVGHKLNH